MLAIRDLLLTKSDCVMLKLSPMLDWRKAVQDLGEKYVTDVHIVSVANECKELLIVMKGTPDIGSLAARLCRFHKSEANERTEGTQAEHEENGNYSIHCVNLLHDGTTQYFSFPTPNLKRLVSRSNHQTSNFKLQTSNLKPQTSNFKLQTSNFLYEPNASIMKAGCFDEVELYFGLQQIEKNSHLFISADFIDNFPGRVFRIDAVFTMNKRELKEHLKDITQANITVRNFPMTVAELRRRLKLVDGGDTYIFATTLPDKRHVLILCSYI